MSESDAYAFLTELFKDLFMRDDIVLSANTKADDIDGWDSYKQVEIIIAIEDRYGIKMSTKEIDGLKNVGDIVAIIRTRSM